MIVIGRDEEIADWVYFNLFGIAKHEFGKCTAIGFAVDGYLIGGVVFHNYQTKIDGSPLFIEASIATVDKRWATRQNLKHIFMYAFGQLKLKRMQAITAVSNERAKTMLRKLGFKQEGTARFAYPTGEHACIFSMLSHECRWI